MRNSDRPFSDNSKAILQPLDDLVGPAIPLNRAATELLAQKITERSLQKHRSWPAFLSAAAAIWLLVGLSGTAAAAVAAYLLFRQAETREVQSKEDSDQQQPTSAKAVSPATGERYNANGLQPASSTGDKPDNARRSSANKPRIAKQNAVVANDKNHRIEPPSFVDKPDVPNQSAIAADVLEQANRLRASQQWRAAERLYTRVYQTHPRSQKARPAMVAAASLRLEHLNDAPGALRLFRKVFRETTAATILAEEACFGIAASHRALGDTAAEIKSLKRFLSTYPNSVLAPRARQRLEHVTTDPSETASTGSAP